MKNKLLMMLSALLLSSPVLSGCRQELDAPPVIVSRAACLLSSAYGTFRHAGVSFTCHNTGSRAIASLDVSFTVYIDATGGNPLYGSNVVSATVVADLSPDETGTFEIGLDQRLARIPDAPFLVDCFYVRKVRFEDGGEWSDPLGLYYAGSLP